MGSGMARYSDTAALCTRFGVRGRPAHDFKPSWKIGAGDGTAIIRRGARGRREVVPAAFGFVLDHPVLDYADGPAVTVPARLLRRSAFLQDLFMGNRCIVPMDAFYAGPAAKGAHLWAFALTDSGIMGAAGLWLHDAKSGRDTCAVITTGPNESVALLQDWMPAILIAEDERAWISAATDPYAAYNVIMPYPAESMRAWPVAAEAGNGPETLRRVA
jgi:putative SOS response-associated peptidase YedK